MSQYRTTPSPKENYVVWIVIDCLTKSAHFIPFRLRQSTELLADKYMKEIVRLHGVLVSIIVRQRHEVQITFLGEPLIESGDPSKIWHILSSRDRWQSERTIQILEDMLRACMIDFKGSWEDHLVFLQ